MRMTRLHHGSEHSRSNKRENSVRKPYLLTVLVMFMLAVIGCVGKAELKPAKIQIRRGNNQFVRPGEQLSEPLTVEVLAARKHGLLGGKGSEMPVPGMKVRFEVLEPARGASISTAEAITDHGGYASTSLTVGRDFGDYFVKAYTNLSKDQTASVTFRAVSGMIISGNQQEGAPGNILEEPLSVTVYDSDGRPKTGDLVRFEIQGDIKGATLSKSEVKVDATGRAETFLKLGSKDGNYYISAQVYDSKGTCNTQPVYFKAFATDMVEIIVSIIGGLALFVYGMTQLSESLERVAGNRLRTILQSMTSNRFMGVLSGFLVTGIVQSSSATTIMVIGFANAGLLSLRQAVSVIYGANIGTTITSQIIAFKLDAVALPAIAVGLVIMLVAKRSVTQAWGNAIMAFGLLFLGMNIMGDSMKPMAQSPRIMQAFTSFDCTPVAGSVPLLNVLYCIMMGIIGTIVVSSSSASVGIIQVMAGSGLINFWTAFPLVLGCQIGTTIDPTQILASIVGTNRNAKRAGLAHVSFNVLGTLLMVSLLLVKVKGVPIFLEIIEYITPGDALGDPPVNVSRHIANAHTMVKLCVCMLMVPLINLHVAFLHKIIPISKKEETHKTLRYLEPHLLNTPTLALPMAVKEVAFMCRQARKAISEAFQYYETGDEALAKSVSECEEGIDRMQEEITNYLTRLPKRQLSEEESLLLPALLHAVNDAERIGDHSENIIELGRRRHEKNMAQSPEAVAEINKLYALIERQFEHTLAALEKADADAGYLAKKEDEKAINQEVERLTENHVKRLEDGTCAVLSGIVFLDMASNLEKIGDHLSNIGSRAILCIKYLGLTPDKDNAE
ncbi:MAG TPA: Na/Pi symporter [Candidatus Brocadiia bacterium]|nr:Na/Pi symporter [Candidatus Brocadiia bacterium]